MSLLLTTGCGESTCSALRTALEADGFETRTVRDPESVESEVASSRPDVLLLGPSVDTDQALGIASRVLEEYTATAVVLIVASATSEVFRAAMRVGVSDVLAADDAVPDMAEAVRVAAENARRKAAGPESSEEAGGGGGRIVTVFSTKGGVGKTVLATNLGVSLARKGKRVILVDLDLHFGDVGIMLGLEPTRTIYDAVQVMDRLDAEMLSGLLVNHSSGLSTLLAPVQPEDAESITGGRVGHILDLLRGMADYVVIDTSPSFSEAVLAAMDKSQDVYVVTMMDVASIKNTRISLQKLGQLGYDKGRLRIVLNRADSKVFLHPSEVEDAIGGSVVARIPSDRLVPRSVNKGVPVVIDEPKSAVAKSMLALADDVVAHATREASHVA